MPIAAVELELVIPDDVGLESATLLLGGAGAILTSFDLAPRAIFVTLLAPLLVGDSMELLLLLLLELGTTVVLLVGDALIVMDLVANTVVLLELAPYGAGDGVPEDLSSSIIASWMARSSCAFNFRPRGNPVEYQSPANSFAVALQSSCSFDGSGIVAAMSVQFVSDVTGSG